MLSLLWLQRVFKSWIPVRNCSCTCSSCSQTSFLVVGGRAERNTSWSRWILWQQSNRAQNFNVLIFCSDNSCLLCRNLWKHSKLCTYFSKHSDLHKSMKPLKHFVYICQNIHCTWTICYEYTNICVFMWFHTNVWICYREYSEFCIISQNTNEFKLFPWKYTNVCIISRKCSKWCTFWQTNTESVYSCEIISSVVYSCENVQRLCIMRNNYTVSEFNSRLSMLAENPTFRGRAIVTCTNFEIRWGGC